MDYNIWTSIKMIIFVFAYLVDSFVENKPREIWIKEDKEKEQYNLKAKTIIIIALGMDEFLCISHYNYAK